MFKIQDFWWEPRSLTSARNWDNLMQTHFCVWSGHTLSVTHDDDKAFCACGPVATWDCYRAPQIQEILDSMRPNLAPDNDISISVLFKWKCNSSFLMKFLFFCVCVYSIETFKSWDLIKRELGPFFSFFKISR